MSRCDNCNGTGFMEYEVLVDDEWQTGIGTCIDCDGSGEAKA